MQGRIGVMDPISIESKDMHCQVCVGRIEPEGELRCLQLSLLYLQHRSCACGIKPRNQRQLHFGTQNFKGSWFDDLPALEAILHDAHFPGRPDCYPYLSG